MQGFPDRPLPRGISLSLSAAFVLSDLSRGRGLLGRDGMSESVHALLVHDQPEPFDSLRRTLTDLGIETLSVSTCRDAEELISQCKPHIILTEGVLRDGSWQNILTVAKTAKVPLNVIVVSGHPDTRFYISAMERGAFDFIAPPFEQEALAFVIRSAALDAQRRRGLLVQTAHT